MRTEWIRCPICGNKTRGRIREDTILKNYQWVRLQTKARMVNVMEAVHG